MTGTGTDLAGWLDPAVLRTRWVDAAMLGLLVLSVLAGLVRGLVFELLSLAGWLAAWFAAQWAVPWLAPLLPLGSAGPAVRTPAAFVCAFLVALVLWGLVVRLVRLLVRASPLSGIDRLSGGVFGALRGAVVLLVVATVVGLTPARDSAAWRASRGALWLNGGLHAVRPMLPVELSRRLPA